MFVPFLELKRESGRCRNEIELALARVLQRGWYVLGPELEALEGEFADHLQIPYAIGVASGTDALTLALLGSCAVTPGMGHEVITSALSAAFTALAICHAGAVPRFADVDTATLQIDPDRIESLIGERTRAILPVHLYGNPCDMEAIAALAKKHGLVVIEDACQAHGSLLHGSHLGTFGTAAGFSFYPTKNLGALGDGGMVVTADREIRDRVRKLRHGGQSRNYHHELLGFNSRLDEIQAAVLRLKLTKMASWNDTRRRLAGRYDEALGDLDLELLPFRPGQIPNRHLYTILVGRRDALKLHLEKLGIQTLIHYPTPIPGQPAFAQFVAAGQEFPRAWKAARETLSLPLYPELTEPEIDHTIRSVRSFFGK